MNGARELWNVDGEINIQQEHPKDFFCAIYPYWMVHQWFSMKIQLSKRLEAFRATLKSHTATTGVFKKQYDYCTEKTRCKCKFCKAKLRIGDERIIMIKKFIYDRLRRAPTSTKVVSSRNTSHSKRGVQTDGGVLRKRKRIKLK